MDYSQIRTAAATLENKEDLLDILNYIKKDRYGEKAHLFTMKQLNYFCNPNRCSSSFRTFTIPKKSGEPRIISAPTQIHKSLLVCVNVLLQVLFVPNDFTMGFIPGRSVVDNARLHIGHNYILNIDLKDFFPSIPQARIWGALQVKPFNFSETIASAIAGLCSMRVGGTKNENGKIRYQYVLPQGSPASPIITNIVCQNLDRRLAGLAKRFGAVYSRYADDITFSSNHMVYTKDGEFMHELERIVTGQNFTINDDKTRLLKKGSRQEVTGLIVSDKVNVVRHYTRDLGSLLYIWETYGYSAASMSFLKHYSGRTQGTPQMERVIEGKLLYLKMVKGEYDHVWQKLQSRFMLLKSKKSISSKNEPIYTLFTKKIRLFESQTGRTVDFRKKQYTVEGKPVVYAVIRPLADGGTEEFVSLTNSCQLMVENVFSSQNTAGFDIIKDQLFISLCSGQAGQFWRIMKCAPALLSEKQKELTDPNKGEVIENLGMSEIIETSDVEDIIQVQSDNHTIDSVPIEQIIEELVSSNDIKVLEKWNMTKNI